ncbi:MAG: 5'/3'-nucleotidase SurE, partial [Maioricimonas sp. JB049]
RAVTLIRQLLDRCPDKGQLWNINFPDTSAEGPRGVKTVPMGVHRHSDTIEKRRDPRGRPYYWSGVDPIRNHAQEPGTDIRELRDGYVTVTPLHFDLTEKPRLAELAGLEWSLDAPAGT